MNYNNLIKIKDSVDLFLKNEEYLIAYFINSRRRKTFKVNRYMIELISLIDGERKALDIAKEMENNYGVDTSRTLNILDHLHNNKIITEVIPIDFISDDDKERFKRQINYFSEFLDSDYEGFKAQKKIFDSKILVFGCGAIGGNLAIQLAMAGVRNFILFDYDVVEESDLARHLFFKKEHLGKLKTEALKTELQKIDSKIIVDTYNQVMHPNTDVTELIERSNFVINSLDEPYIGYTSSKISRLCILRKIPHFICGGFDAHLASTGEIVIPYVTPCVDCYATYFDNTLKNWKPEKHPVKERFDEIGGLSSMSLFSTSFACIEILKYIAGLVDLNNNFKTRGELLFDGNVLYYLQVEKDPSCKVCGGKK